MYLSSKAISICLLCSICGNQEVTKAFIQIFVYYYLCFENHYTCGDNAKSIASILRWRFGQELFFGGTDNF